MKYAVFFLLCVVALASAAPQFLTWPGGVVAGGLAAPIGSRTLVAGPTVVNGYPGWGGQLITPGVISTTYT